MGDPRARGAQRRRHRRWPRTTPIWLLHQKADDGNGKLDRGLEPHLGVPDDFTDWHWATQLNQARAVAHAVTHYRSWWPRTAGAIVWQLNDCWPVTSWAAVDGDERPKPLWWALRAAYADRSSPCRRGPGGEVLAAWSTTPTRLGRARSRCAASGWTARPLASDARRRRRRAPVGRCCSRCPRTCALPDDAADEVLVAELDGVRTVHTLGRGRRPARSTPTPLDAAVAAEPAGTG